MNASPTGSLLSLPVPSAPAAVARRAKRSIAGAGRNKWDTAQGFNTGQVLTALLGFEDGILDVGSRGRAIFPPEARLKIDEADASDRRLGVLSLGVPAFAYKRQEDDCSIYLADLPVENLVLVCSFVARSNDRMQSEHGWNGAVHDCLLGLAFPPGRLAGVQDW